MLEKSDLGGSSYIVINGAHQVDRQFSSKMNAFLQCNILKLSIICIINNIPVYELSV